MTPSPAKTFPWGAVIGLLLLTIAGLALLGYALLTVTAKKNPAKAPTALAPTVLALNPTQPLVVIPTITAPAPVADTPVEEPTAAAAPTEAPADATATGEPMVSINQGANIRSGPGLNYPVIGGLQAGQKLAALGRDSSGQWFVIKVGVQEGWVSSLVASYSGDVSGLPVIAAPPPPPPTNTPAPTATSAPVVVPPTAPPAYTSNGLRGESFSFENPQAGIGHQAWFNFKVVNTTGNNVPYSVLSVHVINGPNGQSWTNEVFKANDTLTWRDNIQFTKEGTYTAYLGICYGGKDACLSNAAGWDRLSPDATIVIK